MSIRRIVPVEQAQWSVAPAPAWLTPRDIDWIWRAPAEQSVAFLLIDEQHHIPTQACSRRWVRQLMSISAVQSLGQVELEFEPAAQRLTVHELVVWRLDPDGAWRKRTPVPREAFLLRQREQQLEQQMLNGRVSLVALMEDVRIGDVIDLAWTVEPLETLPGLAFTTYYNFAWQVAVAHVTFTLHLDPQQPVHWRLLAPPDTVLPVETAQPDSVTWSCDSPPRFESESNVPGSHWAWPMLEVTGWQSWGAVADFVASLWADAFVEDAAAIAAEAARLAGSLDGAAAVAAIVRFVQEDVRYLAVDFGHGAGMLPNGAGTVLRRRFGDCKDKAVLLTALLRARDIEASAVLVAAHWREGIARLQPSLNAFDHAIVRFVVDGMPTFVDPTCIGQRGDLAHFVPPAYGCGLDVAHGANALLSLPVQPSAELSLTETFHLDRKRGQSRVMQTLRATAWFADDLRSLLMRQGRQAFLKTRADSLQQQFPAAVPDADTAEVTDDEHANVLDVSTEYALATWGPVGEPKPPAFFRYGAYGLLLGIETLDERERRAQPWALRYPMRVHHRVVVRGRCVHKGKPSQFRHAGPGFRYACDVTARRHEVTFDYRWESTQAAVSPAEWPDYVRERATALEQTGALVNTQGVSFRTALRASMLGLAVCVMLAQLVLRNLDLPPGAGQGRASVERDAGDAWEAMKRGDIARAYALISPIEPHFRQNFEMQTLHAEAALRTGHFEQAQESLARARELKPDHPLVDLLAANLDEVRGDFAAARNRLETAAQRPAADDKVFVALARMTERVGDLPAARRAWEQVLSRQPAQPEALYSLAHLMWVGGEQARADELITSAVRAQPTPSAVLEGVLTRYFAATGRHHEALTSARRAAELAPADPVFARQYAMAQINAGEREAAVLTAQAMTEKFPDDGLAWGALATAAATASRYELAGPAFERWIALAPTDPDAHASQGYFLHLTGDDARAREVLERGVEQFPAHGNLWLNYAVVLEALGDAAADNARRKAAALMTPEQRATLVR